MVGLAKSALYWYEKIAYEEVGGNTPDPRAPITIDRLWEVCKKYLWGSNQSLLSAEQDRDNYNTHHSYSFYYFSKMRSGPRNDHNPLGEFLVALAIIWLATLVAMWVASGIAFQYIVRNSISLSMKLMDNIFRGFIGILGAPCGMAIGAIMWFFSNKNVSFFSCAKAGAEVGYDLGSKAGKWVGFFAGIAMLPITLVGSAILGVLAGLPMGVLTLVVAPLKFIKTTHQFINSKFDVELQSNNKTPSSSLVDDKNSKLPPSRSEPVDHNQSPLLWLSEGQQKQSYVETTDDFNLGLENNRRTFSNSNIM